MPDEAQTMARAVHIAHSQFGAANSPFSIAEAEGYFAHRGLAVDRQEVPNVDAAVEALAAGTREIVGASGSPILTAALRGLDIVVIMSIESHNLFGVIGARHIASPEQLRGATLGITRHAGQDHVVLVRALEEWAISPTEEVTFVELNSRGVLWESLEAGEIAAMASAIPQPILAASRGLPVLRDFSASAEPYQLGAVVTRRRFLEGNRDLVATFVDAMLQAVHRYRTDYEVAMEHMKARSKINDAVVLRKTYAVFAEGMRSSRPNATALANVARDYARINKAVSALDIASLVDDTLVPR